MDLRGETTITVIGRLVTIGLVRALASNVEYQADSLKAGASGSQQRFR
jgi:hypothetical protein